MNINNKMSWISGTGQRWKMILIAALGFLNLLFLFVFVLTVSCKDDFSFFGRELGRLQARTLFLLSGLVFLFVLFFWIKCPNCKRKTIWLIVKRSDSTGWVSELLTLRKCPACGYRPEKKLGTGPD